MTGQLDTGKPHPARVYDWLLGGKDNYPVDEALARQILELNPGAPHMAKVNRSFMHRSTRWLARNGVRQFLDIGAGIPTEPNLHQVAQKVAPESRIVYADNDPIVLRHAEALLRSTPEGATDYIQADVRDPEKIIELAGEILDFREPVALSLIALLHFVPDEDDAYRLVQDLVGALAPGSYLVLSHATAEFDEKTSEEVVSLYREGGVSLRPRSRTECAGFFEGLELVEPGLVLIEEWRSEDGTDEPAVEGEPVPGYAGVARKG